MIRPWFKVNMGMHGELRPAETPPSGFGQDSGPVSGNGPRPPHGAPSFCAPVHYLAKIPRKPKVKDLASPWEKLRIERVKSLNRGFGEPRLGY